MAYPNIRYADGWFGSEKELTVIPTPYFPFQRNPIPDTYSRTYQRRYQASPKLFLPKITRRTACTNLLTYSEDFTNAAWTKTNLTPTAASGTAPDGNTTLNKLLETVTNGEHNATQAATVTAAATELFCFAVGGLSRDWIRLAFIDSASTTFSAFFNVTSGYAISPSGGVTALVVPLGNGQTQCILRFTPAAGAGTWKVNVSTDGSTISYAGDVTKGIYLWGAQIAAGMQTPYISTTTTSRAVSAPDRDKTDAMAYLVAENDPSIINSEAITVDRLFARIPLQQTVPSSIQVTIPAPVGGGIGSPTGVAKWGGVGNLGLQPGEINSSYLVSQNASYINSVYTVLNSYDYYGPEVAITASTVAGQLRLNWTAHGVTTQDIEFNTNSAGTPAQRQIIPYGYYTIVDADHIDLNGAALSFPPSPIVVAAKKVGTITTGYKFMRCKLVTNYYLLGVSPGISTLNDIPLPTDQSIGGNFFAALIAGSTIKYKVGEWSLWNNTSIIQQTTTQIQSSDVS